VTAPLVVLAMGFAFSMGAHYTGACMGMPHALKAITASRALLVMAPLTLIGATFASHGVEHTVGHDLLTGTGLSVAGLVIVLAVAFGLTSVFNLVRVPTSTIQILVFSVVGTGLATGIGVRWSTIGVLAVIWVSAPVVAGLLGYALTRVLDLVPVIRVQTQVTGAELATAGGDGRPPGADARSGESGARSGEGHGHSPAAGARALAGGAGSAAAGTGSLPGGARGDARSAGGPLATGLIAVGALASFTMGSNDVANATGSLVGTGTLSPLIAGLIGGLGLAAGVLTWGRPLLRKVAFDIVTVDRPMATAAQLVQAMVVLAAVAFGFFTSMNQALIGAMTGAAAARRRRTVHASALHGVLRGWLIGPGAAIALGYAIARVVATTAGAGVLLATR
jgi:PiT family inorganic phosphate transporter